MSTEENLIHYSPTNATHTRGWPRARASVNIFACTISGGIVAVPRAFADASLVFAAGLCFIAGLTTAFSLYTLAMVSQRCGNARSYGEVTSYCLGPFSGQVRG